MSVQATNRKHLAGVRREQILDAALRVFGEKGYQGAGVRDIAREAGITEGLIYHYFTGKSQLLQACWSERGWFGQVERIISDAARLSAREVIELLVREHLASLYSHAARVRMTVSEMLHNPELARLSADRICSTNDRVAGFLRDRKQAGEIRADMDECVASQLLMGYSFSVFMLWGRLAPEEWEPIQERVAREVADLVWRGMAPDPQPGAGGCVS